MPDEYGLPTAEEYERELRQLRQDELMAARREGATRGAQVGGTLGAGLAAIPTLGIGGAAGAGIGTALGGAIGAGLGGLAARRDPGGERLRGQRIHAALEEAQREGILSDAEYQEIANRFLVPTVAGQRSAQQQRLQQAAGTPGTQPGAVFRTQQAADAAAAEDQLRVQAAIEAAADREEKTQREELLRMVEGEEERFEEAEADLKARTDEAFAQFMASAEEIGSAFAEEEKQREKEKNLGNELGEDVTGDDVTEILSVLAKEGLGV
jgi:hypothetical protein